MSRTTLVLAGTGKVGRRVAKRLTARGLPVRVGSRSGEPPFDWDDRSTWGPALDGVGSAYVAHHWDAIPGAAETLGAFAELAVTSGVRRIVLMVGRGEEEAERAERSVRASGVELTVLRASWFAQNFSEDYWRDHVQAGVVALPAGDVPEPFVDADDIADVAVAALTDDRHVGEVYELTGPRLLTFADAVGEISRATGREIRYVPISLEQFAAEAGEQGVPGEVVELLSLVFREVLDGRNARLGDGVRRALGREPRDFGEYARAAAATGVWNTDAAARDRGADEHARPDGDDATASGADVALGAAVVAMGLFAGLFYAFSTAVMPGLTAAEDRTLVDAMQRMIDNPVFPLTFLAAGALTAVALVRARRDAAATGAGWIVAALALYALTCAITFAVHLPLNEELARAGDLDGIERLSAVRDDFAAPWVAWDFVRALASTAAFGCLAWALVQRGRPRRAG